MPVERNPRCKKSLFIFVNFIIMNYFPEYEIKLIRCRPGHDWPFFHFRLVDEAVSDGKPSAGKGVTIVC